ncbi:Poly(A) polymerase type 3 [Bipolaris maydis]|nr:Poly(A) polymerase type 3 [Bipolaris maydis]KAJ6201597.1 Poly(A) polymerase type 3 [Bipolaris maydis]
MAAAEESKAPARMSTTSYDTALCIIPPRSQCGYVDQLRELYDKAFGRWPAHINLVYPFVAPEQLPRAQKQIQDYLAMRLDQSKPINVELTQAGYFKQKNRCTMFLSEERVKHDNGDANANLESLRKLALEAIGQPPPRSTLHLTLGQSEDNTVFAREYLLDKAKLIPHLQFSVGSLAILVRERTTGSDLTDCMRLFATIDICSSDAVPRPDSPNYWVRSFPSNVTSLQSEDTQDEIAQQEHSQGVQPGSTYYFDEDEYKWSIYAAEEHEEIELETLTVASYNVLIDSEYPPTHDRDSLLVVNILSDPAMADILVLQEISDAFLSYMLGDSEIQRRYPFVSHGPPEQPDIGPLPSLRNIVVLSRYPFSWKSVPFYRKHKGAIAITEETASTLSSIETSISDAGLFDAWAVARIEGTDQTSTTDVGELHEGEESATFDPQNNRLAAGTTTTSHDRPQRYDRILFRPNNTLHVIRFNQFGQPETINGVQVVASDHYGIRARLKIGHGGTIDSAMDTDSSNLPSVQLKRAIATLTDSSDMSSALEVHGMIPNDEQTTQRQEAFALLQRIVSDTSEDAETGQSGIPLVIVPVGSYALGVWTSSSDIDCLCIGSISSKTFFKLARQRLVKAGNPQVRILRKVEAATGTMLELSINGILMDLQYCPAAQVVERWSELAEIPASDPIFNLSMLSLRKLKPYRDLLYLQRTIPSRSIFRQAYRLIKLWAVQRGLYAAKFGYLGGMHITLMLSWVCKSLAHNVGSVSIADIVVSFFQHYANFDWSNDMVYDAFFHKKKPRYNRSAREPMVILSFHAPNSNFAQKSTVPGLQTLIKELKAADMKLSEPGMTWQKFFSTSSDLASEPRLPYGAVEFLNTYNDFVKIDIQFWGRMLAKGKSLVGWVESRCISIVVDIHKALPGSEVRVWPALFTDDAPNDSTDSNDFQGCYLIGLSKAAEGSLTGGFEDKQEGRRALEKVLDRFLTQLRTDEKNYDSNTCWIDASLAKRRDVKALQLDDREWGHYVMDMDSDSEDEEEIEEELEDADEAKPQRAIPQRPKPTSTPLSSSKLRPASDVLNRLRWDPSLDPSNYIIGYEDRFLGAKETGLERWKTEQTDEEFIPQHRILYFKKKSEDGGAEIVWERATRIDKVFGSGLGTGK